VNDGSHCSPTRRWCPSLQYCWSGVIWPLMQVQRLLWQLMPSGHRSPGSQYSSPERAISIAISGVKTGCYRDGPYPCGSCHPDPQCACRDRTCTCLCCNRRTSSSTFRHSTSCSLSRDHSIWGLFCTVRWPRTVGKTLRGVKE
jgi:hypothetical protein